jgi:hypothetical protein
MKNIQIYWFFIIIINTYICFCLDCNDLQKKVCKEYINFKGLQCNCNELKEMCHCFQYEYEDCRKSKKDENICNPVIDCDINKKEICQDFCNVGGYICNNINCAPIINNLDPKN